MKPQKNRTINYYENNAMLFAQDTENVGFTDVQDRFLSKLQPGALLLDFGCGSGRDAKYFHEKGYSVDAIDGSAELCKIASSNTGLNVRHMYFSELDDVYKYNGIWACASILHLPKEELKKVFEKMIRAIKTNGVIYTSFKYGDFEGYRGERYYTDFTEKSFIVFLEGLKELEIEECWESTDVRPDRKNERWLNLILRKSDTI
ncbi:MAG: class I SAM-dependent methyltransferase [Lachnospiraceae bacterium]|nr:class I SAM-dependent methyltransferase [Lachnospiraceae bacterium]